jgi:hypothetical protein
VGEVVAEQAGAVVEVVLELTVDEGFFEQEVDVVVPEQEQTVDEGLSEQEVEDVEVVPGHVAVEVEVVPEHVVDEGVDEQTVVGVVVIPEHTVVVFVPGEGIKRSHVSGLKSGHHGLAQGSTEQ